MVNLVKKLDSNVTGIRICEEASIGVLPPAAQQVWYPLEPNSYTDFGAATKTVARMPINPSRQLRKGVLTDLDPAFGIANDLTQDGLTRHLQGFFVADLREDFDTNAYNAKNGSGGVNGVVAASHKFKLNICNATLVANDLVFSSGFASNANNGLNVVSSFASAAAGGVLTSAANYSDGDTVTIGSRVYTFNTVLAAGDGKVKIGASEAASITNLVNAINKSGGTPGTDYNVTAADPNVTAAAAAHTVTVTAINKGYGANAVASTTTSAATWGSATLTGGTADVVVVATSVVDEASPPAVARFERVGHQFASGDLTVANNSINLPTYSSAAVNLTTLPLIPGQWIWVGGDAAGVEFATLANNGWARLRSVASGAFTVDKTSSELVTDAGTGKTVQIFWGKMLQNEATPALQKRRTYASERTLGNPDMSNPTAPQAEYVMGATPNEMTVNMTTADKVTFDLTFMGTDYSTIDTTGTPLSAVGGASAPSIVSQDAFNTTSHVVRAKMSVLSPTDSAPISLFAEITELKFSVKNNNKANKAIGKLGPFEISFGFFEGSGTVQAYFNQVAAIQAVRTNADVSIDLALAENNKGIVFDLPLLTLSTKGLDVKINEPIMLPINLTMGADRNFNTTMVMSFFDYLPNAAMPV